MKKIILALGALGGAGLIGQFTGINNQLVAPVFAYLIGGFPVALIALALPMLTGGGGLGSLFGLRSGNVRDAYGQTSPAGTVYS